MLCVVEVIYCSWWQKCKY